VRWLVPHRRSHAPGEDDDLWFVARQKDLVIRGSSNISPIEVERVLMNPSGRARSSCHWHSRRGSRPTRGRPRSTGRQPGNAALGDILVRAKAQLADYKVPESLKIVDEIPRNALG
jgi:long-chain acyl-CoA synthetase